MTIQDLKGPSHLANVSPFSKHKQVLKSSMKLIEIVEPTEQFFVHWYEFQRDCAVDYIIERSILGQLGIITLSDWVTDVRRDVGWGVMGK